jgi:hypothetical protein
MLRIDADPGSFAGLYGGPVTGITALCLTPWASPFIALFLE